MWEDFLSMELRIQLNKDEVEQQPPPPPEKDDLNNSNTNTTTTTTTVNSSKSEVVPNLNRSCSTGTFHDFIEDTVNDPKTMMKSGVWADHLQLLRAIHFFKVNLWIYREDDRFIKLNDNNFVIPGNDFFVIANNG